MKKHIILLISFTISLLASPEWLYNIKPSHSNEIIGYGVDENLKQAKQNAMDDIVKSISVHVNSSTSISKSASGDNYSKNVSSNIKTEAKALLIGVEVLKVKEIDGTWYVASKYDNSPFELKFKRVLPDGLKNQKQNSYLKGTELVKKLNSSVGVKLDYNLIRKDNLWQFQYNNSIQALKQDDFYNLFYNKKGKNINIKSNQKIYKEYDEMFFNIKLSKKGYVSLLYVEHNGKVGVISSNEFRYKSFTYPDLNSEEAFKISNPYNKTINELYIAIYSKNPVDLDSFENVSENHLDESNYNFNKLIELFNKVDISTYKIKIR